MGLAMGDCSPIKVVNDGLYGWVGVESVPHQVHRTSVSQMMNTMKPNLDVFSFTIYE